MNLLHYAVTTKTPQLSAAIIQGFGAKSVPVETARMQDGPGRVHLVAGLQFGSLPILREVLAAGVPYVFFDRAYFGGGPGSGRYRAVPSAYQKHWLERRPDDRARRFGVKLAPWRKGGHHILLVPPSAAIHALFGLGDWTADTLRRIRAATVRPVMVSEKGDLRPLAQRLDGCHCVVTWTSNVAVEAICAGVPAVVSRHSAAAPMSGLLENLEKVIADPPTPDGRETWAAGLAYGQFTVDEIRDGLAARVVMETFRP